MLRDARTSAGRRRGVPGRTAGYPASGGGGPVVVLSDSFTRADQSPPGTADTGQVWDGNLAVVSNALATTAGLVRRSTVDAGVLDCTVTATWPVVVVSSRLIVRYVDSSNYLYLSGAGDLVDLVGGTPLVLGSLSGGAVVNGNVTAIVLSGPSATVKRDGVTALAATTASLTGTRVGAQMQSTAARLDNLSVTVP